MNPISILDMLPWEIILPIILISVFIPIMLTVFFYMRRRFDDIWVSIGIFLLILSPLTYFYIIPEPIMDELRLPEDFVWVDQGQFEYWQRDGLTESDAIEYTITAQETMRIVEMDAVNKHARMHDEFKNAETGEVIIDPYGVALSEYYWVDARTESLSFLNVNGGKMTAPLGTDINAVIDVGWVESNGSDIGEEHVVAVREMQVVETQEINGVEIWVWESVIRNKPITWHGKDYICSEIFRLSVDPKTSYIVGVERDLRMSAPLTAYIDLIDLPLPDVLSGLEPLIKRFLNNVIFPDGGPIGEAARIYYKTSDESMQAHVEEARFLGLSLEYSSLAISVPMAVVGAMLLTRYFGKGYYWKRYGQYDEFRDTNWSPSEQDEKEGKNRF